MSYKRLYGGDSLTFGTGSGSGEPYVNSYPRQTEALFADNVPFFIKGVPGISAQYFPVEDIIAQYDSSRINICALWLCANDIEANDMDVTFGYLQEKHTALKNARFKTIAVLTLARKNPLASSDSNANTNTKRLYLNNLIKTQLVCDGIADLSNQPLIYSADAPDNATYFNQADEGGNSKVHLTAAGYGLVAIEVHKAFDAIMNRTIGIKGYKAILI